MKNLVSTCVICGKKYTGYGNSTWGYWESLGEPKDDARGEKLRCCDKCNLTKVIPARIALAKMEENKND